MSQSKIKQCQNCESKFVIEPEDFEFYKKIDVPEPTFCPDCRMQRKFAFWNALKLYKGKCDFSGKNIVSIYRSDSPYKIYESKIWWSDKWDPMDYSRDYDFNKPFFEQFKELKLEVPRPHNLNINSVNCDYCAATRSSKNCYLCVCGETEDSAYSIARTSKVCFDNFYIVNGENCYEDLFCTQNYNLYFSQYSDNCIDSAFLYDCRNCQNCFGCVNLRNKKYHIFNKPYIKSEYEKEIKKYDLGSYDNLVKVKKRVEAFKSKFPRRYARVYKSYNVVGDNIRNTKNCHYCFYIFKGIENCKYIYDGGDNLKDSYDIFGAGVNAELVYESTIVGLNARRVYFSVKAFEGVSDIQYSDHCSTSSNLFGCVGLRHKKNCILNKQYTKTEYEKLIPKIIRHMNEMPYSDKRGRVYKYGEFFPIELSPFDYNKSVAQEHFPLNEKQCLKRGYSWYQKTKSEHKPTIQVKGLPDKIKDVNKSILKEIIECQSFNCEGIGVFKIIPSELEFYKKHNLTLPRLCPECRMWARLMQRNPFKLWQRKCQCAGHQSDNKVYQNEVEHTHKTKHCSNEFQTTYAPDRKETVYCEQCYNKEIS